MNYSLLTSLPVKWYVTGYGRWYSSTIFNHCADHLLICDDASWISSLYSSSSVGVFKWATKMSYPPPSIFVCLHRSNSEILFQEPSEFNYNTETLPVERNRRSSSIIQPTLFYFADAKIAFDLFESKRICWSGYNSAICRELKEAKGIFWEL